MNILLANDDGYDAEGIWLLARALKKYGNITIVAPETQQSATSHSIIMHRGIRFEFVKEEDGIKCYKTNGKPADCVRLGTSILDTKFDMVFSGINNGLNCGTDIIYSGTVGVAVEATIEGIPAVAVSTDTGGFDLVRNELDGVLAYVFDNKLYSKDYAININFPIHTFSKSKGIKHTVQGAKKYKTDFTKAEDGLYYPTSNNIIYDDNPETDANLVIEGYITITEVGLNLSK